MRSEEEVKTKLARLIKVQKAHSHQPAVCSRCGQPEPIIGTWIPYDFSYLEAEIASLEWILGFSDHLTEDHT